MKKATGAMEGGGLSVGLRDGTRLVIGYIDLELINWRCWRYRFKNYHYIDGIYIEELS